MAFAAAGVAGIDSDTMSSCLLDRDNSLFAMVVVAVQAKPIHRVALCMLESGSWIALELPLVMRQTWAMLEEDPTLEACRLDSRHPVRDSSSVLCWRLLWLASGGRISL